MFTNQPDFLLQLTRKCNKVVFGHDKKWSFMSDGVNPICAHHQENTSVAIPQHCSLHHLPIKCTTTLKEKERARGDARPAQCSQILTKGFL